MKYITNLLSEIKKIRWSNNTKTLLVVLSTIIMILFLVAIITLFTYLIGLVFHF